MRINVTITTIGNAIGTSGFMMKVARLTDIIAITVSILGVPKVSALFVVVLFLRGGS